MYTRDNNSDASSPVYVLDLKDAVGRSEFVSARSGVILPSTVQGQSDLPFPSLLGAVWANGSERSSGSRACRLGNLGANGQSLLPEACWGRPWTWTSYRWAQLQGNGFAWTGSEMISPAWAALPALVCRVEEVPGCLLPDCLRLLLPISQLCFSQPSSSPSYTLPLIKGHMKMHREGGTPISSWHRYSC